MEYLTKKEFYHKVGKMAGVSLNEATKVMNASHQVVKDVLAQHKGIREIGFGKFVSKHYHARNGRNPQTGQKITIAARNVPRFKPSANLKKSVN